MIGQVKTLPGFVRGIWTTDGTTGLSFQLHADENVARQLVDNATVPPAQRSSSAPPECSQSSAIPPGPPDISRQGTSPHWRDGSRGRR